MPDSNPDGDTVRVLTAILGELRAIRRQLAQDPPPPPAPNVVLVSEPGQSGSRR